ncbi:MAG: DUF4861 family protein [Bacteroidota bacterium]
MKEAIYPKNKTAAIFTLAFPIPKKKITALILFICVIINYAFAKDPRIHVTVSNLLNLNRSSEMVVLQWNDLRQKILTLDPARTHVFDATTNIEFVTQVIDKDHDGTPEELIFCSGFKAKETREFIVETWNKGPKTAESLTDVRFMIPREDIAWENDRIAHRIYGPAFAKELNNGIDVWTKRVRYPIIEKWYRGDEVTDSSRISYHEDHGEGADFFDVGRTLGAGSCALYKNDSLYQPGVFASYRILATGPIRAMFEVTYKPVLFEGKSISEVKRFAIDAGVNLDKIEVTYRCDSSTETVPFAAGIVKRKGVISFTDKENRSVSLWGQTNDNIENGSLGTGIIMTKEAFSGIKEDKIHLLITGTVKLGKTATYYAGAGWTRSGDFNNSEDWNNYLKEFSQRVGSPLNITLAIEE